MVSDDRDNERLKNMVVADHGDSGPDTTRIEALVSEAGLEIALRPFRLPASTEKQLIRTHYPDATEATIAAVPRVSAAVVQIRAEVVEVGRAERRDAREEERLP